MNKILLLLIEDDPMLAEMYKKFFAASSRYELVAAKSGKSGLNKIKTLKPKAVILDLIMEDLDGFEILAAMQKAKINIPVVVATNADVKIAERALSLGAKEILRKTLITPQQVLEVVERYLK